MNKLNEIATKLKLDHAPTVEDEQLIDRKKVYIRTHSLGRLGNALRRAEVPLRRKASEEVRNSNLAKSTGDGLWLGYDSSIFGGGTKRQNQVLDMLAADTKQFEAFLRAHYPKQMELLEQQLGIVPKAIDRQTEVDEAKKIVAKDMKDRADYHRNDRSYLEDTHGYVVGSPGEPAPVTQ